MKFLKYELLDYFDKSMFKIENHDFVSRLLLDKCTLCFALKGQAVDTEYQNIFRIFLSGYIALYCFNHSWLSGCSFWSQCADHYSGEVVINEFISDPYYQTLVFPIRSQSSLEPFLPYDSRFIKLIN